MDLKDDAFETQIEKYRVSLTTTYSGDRIIDLITEMIGDFKIIIDSAIILDEVDLPNSFIESFNRIKARINEEIPAGLEDNQYNKKARFERLYNLIYFEGRVQVGSDLLTFATMPELLNRISSVVTNKKISTFFTDTNNARTSELLVELEANNNSAKDLISKLNQASGKLVAKDFAATFTTESETQKTNSMIWIGSGITSLLLFFGWLIYNYKDHYKIFPINEFSVFNPYTAVNMASRALVASIFLFLVSFCFKQFRIKMHLSTLNKHRANVLNSFDLLVNAPDKLDPESYNAILKEVTKAIYESGQTGYLNIENDKEMPSIVDFKNIISSSKS
jgi:hypothetical protein